jgi:A/G-specific adenine glycosylase
MHKKEFTQLLTAWGQQNDRPMPWKGEKNPYFIWLSEIILQQTRVEQGTKYFLAFKENYPTVFDLASANEEDVLKLWEGLGYYSRARNLHFTAKYIVSELDGAFPDNFQDLLTLKGIGAYTASAIASFAFDIPKAVVDGNVVRVLSRVFGVENTFQKAQEKKEMQELADSLITKKLPAIYNQAIMDFGAQVCTPKNYSCDDCIFSKNCFANEHDLQSVLPLKKKKVKIKKRYFSFLVIKQGNMVFLEKREKQDIWKGLYQFPKMEREETLIDSFEIEEEVLKTWDIKSKEYCIENVSEVFIQSLTHQKLFVNFIEINLISEIKHSFINTDIDFLSKFAFPKIINVYLSSKKFLRNGK